jgi:group I intron endonuclease
MTSLEKSVYRVTRGAGIYAIQNAIDRKIYIGQTINLERRRYLHFWQLRRGIHPNPHLQAAWNRDGRESFEFRILECIQEGMLDIREQEWISYHSSDQREKGYNLDSGGKVNHHHSAATIEKISAAQRGKKRKPLSEEHRRKIAAAHLGHHYGLGYRHTPEALAKISAASKRRMPPRNPKLTEDQVRQIRQLYQTGRWSSPKLGRRFAVSPNSILAIIHRRNWKTLS